MNDLERDELVSAYIDGEATEDERSRVEIDPVLSARAEELRRAAQLAGTPAQAAAADREAAVRAALGELAGPVSDLTRRRERRMVVRWIGAAAAVLAVMVIGASVLRPSDHRIESATSATSPTSSAATATRAAEAAPQAAGAAGQPPGTADLGTFSDDASLAAAARAAVSARTSAAGAAGSATDGVPTAGGQGSVAALSSCAEVDTGYGAVVLDAPATLGGTRVRVIVQQSADGAQQLTVLAGCEVIFRQAL